MHQNSENTQENKTIQPQQIEESKDPNSGQFQEINQNQIQQQPDEKEKQINQQPAQNMNQKEKIQNYQQPVCIILEKISPLSIKILLDRFNYIKFIEQTFKTKQDYRNAIERLKSINQIFEKDLMSETNFLGKYISVPEQNQLKYPIEICTLANFTEVRAQKGVFWWTKLPEAVFILHNLLKMINALYDKKFFLDNLQPFQIILTKKTNDFQAQFQLQLVNYHNYSTQFQQISTVHSKEFTHFDILHAKIEKFESEKQRKQYDFYTIARIFASLLLSSTWVNEKLPLEKWVMPENSKQGNQELIEKLDKYYPKSIVQILDQMLNFDQFQIQQEAKESSEDDFILNTIEKLYRRPLEDKECLIPKIILNQIMMEFRNKNQLTLEIILQQLQFCRKYALHEIAVYFCENVLGFNEILKSPVLVCYYLLFLHNSRQIEKMDAIFEQMENILNTDYAFRTNQIDKKAYLQILLWKAYYVAENQQENIKILNFCFQGAEQHFGLKSPEFAQTLFFTAWSQWNYEAYKESLKTFEECIALQKQIYGPNDLYIAFSLQKYARCLMDQKKYEEAWQAFKQEKEIRQTIQGKFNSEYIAALIYEIEMLININNFELAKELCAQEIELTNQFYGVCSVNHSEAIFRMAFIYELEKNFKEEINIFEKGLMVLYIIMRNQEKKINQEMKNTLFSKCHELYGIYKFSEDTFMDLVDQHWIQKALKNVNNNAYEEGIICLEIAEKLCEFRLEEANPKHLDEKKMELEEKFQIKQKIQQCQQFYEKFNNCIDEFFPQIKQFTNN